MAWVCCQKIKHYLPCWPNNKGTLIHHHFVLFGHQGCQWHFGHMIKDSCIWIFILYFEWIIAEVSIAANDAFCHIYLHAVKWLQGLTATVSSMQSCCTICLISEWIRSIYCPLLCVHVLQANIWRAAWFSAIVNLIFFVLYDRETLWWTVTAMVTFPPALGNDSFLLRRKGWVSLRQLVHVSVFVLKCDCM